MRPQAIAHIRAYYRHMYALTRDYAYYRKWLCCNDF